MLSTFFKIKLSLLCNPNTTEYGSRLFICLKKWHQPIIHEVFKSLIFIILKEGGGNPLIQNVNLRSPDQCSIMKVKQANPPCRGSGFKS